MKLKIEDKPAAREDIGVAVWEDWLAKMEINVGGSYLTQNCVF